MVLPRDDATSQEEVICGYDSLTACSSDGGRHCQTINGVKAECKDD
ncbi:10761_t:CDS:2 [Funneliformis mosseae]|uniref:10761_t:CDS:1 n=1 Tax=Funneliformis mosseae TaxID=27381 RepID=A0A9N9C4L9_FUNMO|nr:10761_t:CDS:2 [Funneliformis mosseae]